MQPTTLVRFGMISALVVVLAACGSTGDTKDTGSSSAGASATGATTSAYDSSSDVKGSAVTNAAADEDIAVMAVQLTKVYYFDFDSAVIRSDSTEALDLLAKYLEQNRARSVALGGHADERGTREYNMALGERRAKAVENYLLLQGAYRAQLETVSYGEEKPVMMGHDESSWAKNRRVEAQIAE
ncbi:MAG: peptidoglycan-associated lipoprotein Pal [Pseudomonadales bacterium]|nr:peptidoglycan-associated lipoprotein Pal [Pseudomonadales bacterium]